MLSSLTAARVTLAEALGWLLTISETVSVSLEKGVLPLVPMVVILAVDPAVPDDWSQARKVIDWEMVPCQAAAGVK